MNPNHLAKVLALFFGFAGIMHFASPSFFNDIVPPWLPPSREFWTYISGVAEIAVAIALIRPSTRRTGAIAAVWLFIAVYPANIYMVWDWRNEVASQQFISWARLPFQFLFIWVALKIAQANTDTDKPKAPGDI
ncbi:MAG: hypothetical protein RL374_29 [Actinomycetota bacterium]|jgi:uncharacterized membrane protein